MIFTPLPGRTNLPAGPSSAHEAMMHLARLKSGDFVLIHAAGPDRWRMSS